MIEAFDIQRVSLGGPIFDVEKLSWLNGLWIREELSLEQLADRLRDWAFNRERLLDILPHAQPRMETFSDLAPLAAFFFSGKLPLTADSFQGLAVQDEALLELLQLCVWQLDNLREWNRDAIFQSLKTVADALELKMKDFVAPLFIAVAGTTASISVFDSMVVLGPDMSRARLRDALNLLGGVGKKKLKKLEKRYAEIAS